MIELPKLPKKLRADSSRVELWAKFINAEKAEEFDMIAEKDPYIKSAYDQLQIISQDKQKRIEYEARQKAILDYNQSIYEAEQRGEQRSIHTTAKNPLTLGIAINTIAAATGLSNAEIESLKKEL